MQLVAQVLPRHRRQRGRCVLRIAEPALGRRGDEAAHEVVGDGIDHYEALGRDAGLPGIVEARLHRRRHGDVQIGVVQHHEGVAAAEFHHALLQLFAGVGGDGAAGTLAAGQRHRGDARVAQHRGGLVVVDVQHVEHAVRHPGGGQRGVDRIGAARHVAGVLEQRHVAGHQRRRQEAEHLPEREIPRHHCQHAAQRLVAHVAALRIGGDRLLAQVVDRMFGVVVAGIGALVDLGQRLLAQLAHLRGHQPLDLLAARAQLGADLPQQRAALRKRRFRPGGKRLRGRGQAPLDGGGIHQLQAVVDLAGGGIDGVVGHRDELLEKVRPA